MERRSYERLSDSDFRYRWISEAAYYKAEVRNFAPGGALDDWLYAEHQYIEIILRPHTLSKFDSELCHLHCQIVKMADSVLRQLRDVILAFAEKNLESVEMVLSRDHDIHDYQINLDILVASILGTETPVANDLRLVLSLSKIGYELERIGNEIAGFGLLVENLLNPDSSNLTPTPLDDVVMVGYLMDIVISKLITAIKNMDYSEIEPIRQYIQKCEITQQEGIKHQLAQILVKHQTALIIQDQHIMNRAVDIMKIIKTFGACTEHCRDIIEYISHMIDFNKDYKQRIKEPVMMANF